MLVIMSKKPHNNKKLINFCINNLTAKDITNFYNVNGTLITYKRKIMPKFKFKSMWELDSNNNINSDANYYVPYMKIIFSNDINLQNIYKNIDVGNDSIQMQSSSQITNNEKGMTIISKTKLFAFNSYDSPSLSILKIDKSFIWMIVNADRVICNVGIFVG